MGVTISSPAKLNLFLAVTGRRADGYHELVSVAAPLDFGDTLEAEETASGDPGKFTLECDVPDVPIDGSNLILKAAQAFAAATGWRSGAHFRLVKRIPMGAGLGGGSSNAVAALRALNRLAGGIAPEMLLAELATGLGSDCALFLRDGPCVMRGRGERVEALPTDAASRLRGRRALVFKPGFSIATPWAYARMAARGVDYVESRVAEEKLAAWTAGSAAAEELLSNNMEPVAFGKYPALPLMLARLRRECGVEARMSGSGSACFALLGEGQAAEPLVACIRECLGPVVFTQSARIA